MISPDVKIHGLREMERQLRKLYSGDLLAGAKVIRSALMSASLPMYRAMQARAPVAPPPGVRQRSTRRGGKGTPLYRIRRSRRHGLVEIRPGYLKMRVRRRSYINRTGFGNRNVRGRELVKVRLGAFTPYAYMVETGTGRAMAQPFVRPAFDAGHRATVDRFAVLLGKRLDKLRRTR
ncbi:hypothetical protein CI610_00351 [invertebrate metagenome]|uniref:Phage protein n=1 Tax=invertebrate metagenome TaxID=1711999 RepID=A0A2H9TBR6_9ZZZZ